MIPQNNKARISKELEAFQKEDSSKIKIQLVGDDISHWKGYINGPEETPYEGGLFQIDIVLPTEYPYKPPKMKFDTKIWHPNVSSQTGAICLDILKNEWSPALSVRTALLSLQALMCEPQPDDPQDAQVAGQFKTNKELFTKTAKEWTKLHANTSVQDEKVKQLLELGFSEEKCRQALQKYAWEVDPAINYLLENAQ